MHPRALLTDVGHLKKVGVQSGLPEGFLEHGLMGPGSASSHHHPIQPLLLDGLNYMFDRINGTTEDVLLDVNHAIQALGICHQSGHVYHPGDIGAAATNEHPDPGRLPGDIPLRGVLLLRGQGATLLREGLRRESRCAASHGYGVGDVHRGTEHAAGVDPWPGGLNGREIVAMAKSVGIDIDGQFLRQFPGAGG
ncbi:hypothetical protein ES703_18057 [subsurface metagenome]